MFDVILILGLFALYTFSGNRVKSTGGRVMGSTQTNTEETFHPNKQKRVYHYDIGKGFGIIFVVLAHSIGDSAVNKIINQFHMPFFFLISGLLYSNKKDPLNYAKGKLFSLYIPFAFWNCLSIIMKMVFMDADLKQTIKHLAGILLTLTKDGQFFGATWFLAALFQITILYRLVDKMLEICAEKIKSEEQKRIVLFIVFVLLGIVGFAYTFPFALSRTLILGAFFAFGVLIKEEYVRIRRFDRLASVILSVLSFFIIVSINRIHMGNNYYRYPVLFVIGAILASYSIIYISRWVDGFQGVKQIIRKGLIYVGKHSIDILIWHFVVFRIVIIIQLLIEGTEITLNNVLQYYPTYIVKGGWWFVYLLVGLSAPLLSCGILRKTKVGEIMMKAHIL